MSDSDIAAAIFRSYGIIPYVEATNERARTSQTVTLREEVFTALNNVSDSEDQAESRRELLRHEGFNPQQIEAMVHNFTVDDPGEEDPLGLQNRGIHAQSVTQTPDRTTTIVTGRTVVQKAGTSDWEFLKNLAATHDYIVFVFFHYPTRDWIGYFGPKQHVPQMVTYVFQYAKGDDTTLAEFRPKISTKNQKTDMDLLYVDPVSGRENRLRVSMENISRYSPEFRGPDGPADIQEPVGSGPEVVLVVQGQRTSVTANRRFSNLEDARRWLMSFWLRYASEFCEAEGVTIIGLPELHARHRHAVDGVGRFGGEFFFTKVSHRMSSGSPYQVNFSAYRIIDAFDTPANADSDNITSESNEIGQLTPEARDVLTRWREALGVP